MALRNYPHHCVNWYPITIKMGIPADVPIPEKL